MTVKIIVRDPSGHYLTEIRQEAYSRLEYARAEGEVGPMYLDLNPRTFDQELLRTDLWLEPWRTVRGYPEYLDGESVFFLRKWSIKTNSGGEKVIRLTAYDANDIIRRHIAPYFPTHAKDEITSETADNALKTITAENMGAEADDTARSLATWMTIAADKTLAPVVYKQYSNRELLGVFQEICADSLKQLTYLTWDVVWIAPATPTAPATLEFRTYTGQRGMNRAKDDNNRMVVSEERLNLAEPELIEDHTNEITSVYASWKDETYKTATDTVALGQSPFNRCEKHVSAISIDATDDAQAEANAALNKGRARKSLMGKLVDTDYCFYGVHYRFGDVVYAEYEGKGYDAHVNAFHVTVNGGIETVDIGIKAES